MKKKILVPILMLLLFVSPVLASDYNITASEDITARDWNTYTASLLKFNISSTCDTNISYARVCMYKTEYTPTLNNNINVYRTDDQTWTDTDGDQAMFDLLDAWNNKTTIVLENITADIYCLNVTDQVLIDYGLDNTYSTVIFEHTQKLYDRNWHDSLRTSYIYLGDFLAQRYLFNDIEDSGSVGVYPTLEITCEEEPEEEVEAGFMQTILTDVGVGTGAFITAITEPVTDFILALGIIAGTLVVIYGFSNLLKIPSFKGAKK